MSIEVESAPTVLHVFAQEDSTFILFGTIDGRIGLLDLERFQEFFCVAKHLTQNLYSVRIPSANGY